MDKENIRCLQQWGSEKIYLKKLEKYGFDLFFECNFDEKDIRTCS